MTAHAAENPAQVEQPAQRDGGSQNIASKALIEADMKELQIKDKPTSSDLDFLVDDDEEDGESIENQELSSPRITGDDEPDESFSLSNSAPNSPPRQHTHRIGSLKEELKTNKGEFGYVTRFGCDWPFAT